MDAAFKSKKVQAGGLLPHYQYQVVSCTYYVQFRIDEEGVWILNFQLFQPMLHFVDDKKPRNMKLHE